eukprot:1160867-Pelagomonas_calceolata.AAC.3
MDSLGTYGVGQVRIRYNRFIWPYICRVRITHTELARNNSRGAAAATAESPPPARLRVPASPAAVLPAAVFCSPSPPLPEHLFVVEGHQDHGSMYHEAFKLTSSKKVL